MKLLFRQGDVYIFENKDIDKTKLKPTKEYILAKGEITGHKHWLKTDTKESSIDIFRGNDFIDALIKNDTATIIHEEHKPITLEPGSYTIKIQQEYDPIQYKRNVLD